MFKSLFGGKKPEGFEVGGTKDLLTISFTLPSDPEASFAAFVDDFGAWWPRDYTWAGESLAEIGIEARSGGACFETGKDGARQIWGTVLTIERPHHMVLAWQISPDRNPVELEAAASRVDVRFTPGEDGGTMMLLVHRDFPRHGDGWEAYRGQMAGAKGWPKILEAFRDHLANR